jgi:hypothetical protein
MAGFPEGFDFHLIVRPEDDPTHPFPDKAQTEERRQEERPAASPWQASFDFDLNGVPAA